MMKNRAVSRELPVLITFVVGVALITDYYVQYSPLKNFANSMNTWAVLFASWMAGLAVLVTTYNHINHVRKRTPKQWYFSAWLLGVLWFTIGLGTVMGAGSVYFTWLFNNIAVAVYGAMTGTTAFFIMTASYRAFRARKFETGFMIVIAVLVALGNITLGTAIWLGFRGIRDYLFTIVGSYGEAGIVMSMAIGAIAVGIRSLIGMERGVYGD